MIGLSHGTYWDLVGKVKEGDNFSIHGNERTSKTRNATLYVEAILCDFLEENTLPKPHLSCKLPNGEEVTKKHLPMGLRKKEIFECTEEKLKERGKFIVSSHTKMEK